MRRFAIACAVLSCAVATASAAASLKDVDPQALKAAQCMLAVLKKEPGIDEVKLGAVERKGLVYPYLEYRSAPDKDRAGQLFDSPRAASPASVR